MSRLHRNKGNPCTGLDRAWGFQEAEAPRLQDNRHMKMVRSSALPIGCLYPQEIFLILISVKRLSRPQGHSAAGRIKIPSEIEYAIFRLVAQCLNQLRHRVWHSLSLEVSCGSKYVLFRFVLKYILYFAPAKSLKNLKLHNQANRIPQTYQHPWE